MEESQIDLLEKQLDAICNRISGLEQRLKILRRNDSSFPKTKVPQYARSAVFTHSSTFKPSPFAFSLNKPPQTKTPLQKQLSGICIIPNSIRLPPSSDMSDDSDDYFSSDGNASRTVTLEEVAQNLPKNWSQMIHQHNKEVEKLTFGKVEEITSEEVKLFFQL